MFRNVTIVFLFLIASLTYAQTVSELRLGYFPNITHSQALIGVSRGDFVRGLGPQTRLVTTVFNAGPSVIEALFAGKIDLAYIGPSPAINGFVKSKGAALRIVAGATSGGASLVVRKDLAKNVPQSLTGKKLSSPQLGNTQDVALRTYLKSRGISSTVIPMDNALILDAFRRGDIDGAWLPEPWASRLILEAGAVRAVDERTLWDGGRFPSAVIIASTAFLKAHPESVRAFLKVHSDLTDWGNSHPAEAKALANSAIEKITGKAMPNALLDESWEKMLLETTVKPENLAKGAKDAQVLGFLRGEVDLTGLVDLSYN